MVLLNTCQTPFLEIFYSRPWSLHWPSTHLSLDLINFVCVQAPFHVCWRWRRAKQVVAVHNALTRCWTAVWFCGCMVPPVCCSDTFWSFPFKDFSSVEFVSFVPVALPRCCCCSSDSWCYPAQTADNCCPHTDTPPRMFYSKQ